MRMISSFQIGSWTQTFVQYSASLIALTRVQKGVSLCLCLPLSLFLSACPSVCLHVCLSVCLSLFPLCLSLCLPQLSLCPPPLLPVSLPPLPRQTSCITLTSSSEWHCSLLKESPRKLLPFTFLLWLVATTRTNPKVLFRNTQHGVRTSVDLLRRTKKNRDCSYGHSQTKQNFNKIGSCSGQRNGSESNMF